MTNPFTNARRVAEQFDPEEYHKPNAKRGDPALVLTRSSLMEFAACPLDWLNSEPTGTALATGDEDEPQEDAGDKKDTKATRWGSLIDCILLDLPRLTERFAIRPKTYTNNKGEEKKWSANATVCKEWSEGQAGKVEISHELYAESKVAMARFVKDPIAFEYIQASKKQVLCIADYVDPETGLVIPFKILIDLEPDAGHKLFGRSLGDFKTARDLTPEKWSRDVFEYEYYVQAKLYLDLHNAATGQQRDEFKHVIQANKAPYGVARRWIDEGFMQLGYDAYTAALKRYARCLATGVWPGIDDEDDSQGIIKDGWRQTGAEAWMVKP